MSYSFLLYETTIGRINDILFCVRVCVSLSVSFWSAWTNPLDLCPCSFASAAVVEACPFGTRPASGHWTSKAAIKQSHGFVVASYYCSHWRNPLSAVRTKMAIGWLLLLGLTWHSPYLFMSFGLALLPSDTNFSFLESLQHAQRKLRKKYENVKNASELSCLKLPSILCCQLLSNFGFTGWYVSVKTTSCVLVPVYSARILAEGNCSWNLWQLVPIRSRFWPQKDQHGLMFRDGMIDRHPHCL